MKKKFLACVNILLGAISLSLVGCHTAKQATVLYGPPPEEKYGIPEPEMVAMYGVPTPIVEEQQDKDVITPDRPPKHDVPVCKYGIPMP